MSSQSFSLQQFLEHKVLESKLWLCSITAVILLNSIVLGLDTIPHISKAYSSILSLIDSACLVIFVIELSLRIGVYRKRFFFGKEWGWNWFDFIIIVGSVLASGGFAIFRAFRVIRVFRLLSIVPSLRIVSAAMLHTIPSMIGITILLLIFYYIYGVLCVNLFGERFPEFFGDLGTSFFTLFQVMTLESWAMGIVRPIMEVYPYAWIVFVSYIFIVSFIVLNLIVGVVVESIAEIKERGKSKSAESSQSHSLDSSDSSTLAQTQTKEK